MINFASLFIIGKAHWWETLPKCGARLSYHLVLGHFVSQLSAKKLSAFAFLQKTRIFPDFGSGSDHLLMISHL
jgi:hypothetical protein